MLDGNARLNLATFVTTWMEPAAGKLMAECLGKNMIDKDDYPQTAELERRCVAMLARLWGASQDAPAVGCSTTGSSEAAMLGGMALKRRWAQRRRAAGLAEDRPNLVMGANVQVCWEKFCRYWDVEPRLVPVGDGSTCLDGRRGRPRTATSARSASSRPSGSTFDGAYEPVAEIAAELDRLQDEHGIDAPIHVDAASGGFVAPFIDPDLRVGLPPAARRVDQCLGPQVRPRLSRRRLGGVARQGGAARRAHLPRRLPRRRHADIRTELLAPGRPGRRAVLHAAAPGLRRLPARAAGLPRQRRLAGVADCRRSGRSS